MCDIVKIKEVASPESVLSVHGAKINVVIAFPKRAPIRFIIKKAQMKVAELFPLKCNLSIMMN